ncbi:MAG: histidine phosphatase family protein [Burkholderiales bacterium]|nr:histidine phosphatase family protein [Burkholderiales bacterium]
MLRRAPAADGRHEPRAPDALLRARRLWFRSAIGVALAGALSGPACLAASDLPAFELIRRGGVAVLMRHSETVPGTGDPPGFRLDDCSTQRNLSERGKAQARALGERFRRAGIRFDRVLTSQWCRCRDTAVLIAGQAEDWPAVNSFFEDRSTEARQTAEALARLATLGPNERWLVVTHQVNISALTGVFTQQGEALVVRPRRDGDKTVLEVLGRIPVSSS